MSNRNFSALGGKTSRIKFSSEKKFSSRFLLDQPSTLHRYISPGELLPICLYFIQSKERQNGGEGKIKKPCS